MIKKEYNRFMRHQEIGWLLIHVSTLVKSAKEQKDSSIVIYSCLESRNLLETLELTLLLLSIGANSREELVVEAKNKNGIERANNKIKSLRYKYQVFFEVLGEVIKIENITGAKAKFFNFQKSDELKSSLSQYIHTYWKSTPEIQFSTLFIQDAFPLIENTLKFVNDYLESGGKRIIQGLGIDTLPIEDQQLLSEWKTSTKMTREDLKNRLTEINENRLTAIK